MKLAILHDYLETIGGAERVALSLAEHFGGDLVTTTVEPSFVEHAGFGHVNVISLGRLRRGTPFKQVQASWKFARARLPGYDFYIFSGNWAEFAAKRHRPNLYYCHTPTRMFYDQRDASLARLSRPGRIAARLWFATHGPLERRAVRRCERIVANSENVRARVRRVYGRDAEVIHPPVDTARLRFQELGDFWLSVSRIYPEKRIDLQLDIFRRLPRERLVIVGGHTAGDRTERYASALDPPPNVTFLGEIAQEELRDLYARCRGLVTTAVDEDFGLTPVEAMASGKCVLATDEGGYRETVVPGKTGFLLPPDADAFAAKIRALDDATLRSMRDACIARAREFDASAFFGKMRAAMERTA